MDTAVPGLGPGLVDPAMVAHHLVDLSEVYLGDQSRDEVSLNHE